MGPNAVLGAGRTAPFPTEPAPPRRTQPGPGKARSSPLSRRAPPSRAGRLHPRMVPVEVSADSGRSASGGLPGRGHEAAGPSHPQRAHGASAQALQFILAGLSNGDVSKTATPEEYDACFYEGSFTLFGRHQGPRYQAFAGAMLAEAAGRPGRRRARRSPHPRRWRRALDIPGDPARRRGREQPAATAKRFDRATFQWRGGDPAIDAPRNQALARSSARMARTGKTIGTEEGFYDTTQHYEHWGPTTSGRRPGSSPSAIRPDLPVPGQGRRQGPGPRALRGHLTDLPGRARRGRSRRAL